MVKPAVEDIRTRTKKKVIHQVITERSWKTEEYAKYLKEHEQTVLSLFGQEVRWHYNSDCGRRR